MGLVHRAVHGRSGAEVALKTVRPANPGVAASLRREIATLARIRHPGVVRIVEDGDEDGRPWYAMEIVVGRTLRAFLKAGSRALANPRDTVVEGDDRVSASGLGVSDSGWWTDHPASTLGEWASFASGTFDEQTLEFAGPGAHVPVAPLPLLDGLRLVRRLCEALAYLHGEGIVHRDLKPENIIVRPDQHPVLVDFGLMARVVDHDGREPLEVASVAIGTCTYMAPEQAKGDLVDARADLYALGCILYELACGQPPFSGSSAEAILYQHANVPPEAPSDLAPGIQEFPGLERLIMGLLAKDPRARVGHARDVASALTRMGAGGEDAAAWPVARSYLYRAAFVGRGPELGSLVARLSRLADGRGEAVLIAGESGVGKTRLLVELCREARQRRIRVLACQCPPPSDEDEAVSTTRPLEPLRPVLQRVADRCQGGADELESLLGEQSYLLALYEPSLADVTGPIRMRPDELSLEQATLRLYQSVEQSLSVLRGDRPAILALDDLQWADELTLGFVRYLIEGGRLERLGVMLLGTYRAEDAPHPLATLAAGAATTVLPLGRLDEDAVRSLVGDMLALTEPPDSLVRFLSRHTEGNPFFVSEYLHAALDDGLLSRDSAGRWQVPQLTRPGVRPRALTLPLPRGVRDLLGRRIDDLSEDAQRVVTCAAVVGRRVDLLALETICGLTPASYLAGLQEIVSRGLVEDESQHIAVFRHAKTREVAYGRMPPDDRAAVHRELADHFARRRVDARFDADLQVVLGHHWERGGVASAAAHCYLSAARTTADRYAEREAERLYRMALHCLEGDPSGASEVQLELVERILLPGGRISEALMQARAALEVADRTGDAGTAARAMGLLSIASRR